MTKNISINNKELLLILYIKTTWNINTQFPPEFCHLCKNTFSTYYMRIISLIFNFSPFNGMPLHEIFKEISSITITMSFFLKVQF